MRLLLVQYAGDFLAAHRRLQQSQTETYYGHRYILEQLGAIAQAGADVAILCGIAPKAYDETLPSGLRVMAAGVDPTKNVSVIARLAETYDPTHLVVLGPLTGVIKWGLDRDVRIAGIFADSFDIGALHRFYRYGLLGSLLNSRRIEWIANHGVNACQSLARLGVAEEKIIPWDWPHVRSPADVPARDLPEGGAITLAFVGAVTRNKGVGDTIRAVALLKKRGLPVVLKIAGDGELDRFKALARKLDVLAEVQFLGLIANDEVFKLMRTAFAVVVPSRHAYPEGLPLTIYEALCARTPIIASDHPMFARHLNHLKTAMVFPAGDARALADRVAQLASDPLLYRSLSEAAEAAWKGLGVPVRWGDFLHRWIRDEPEDRRWLFAHRLNSGLYD